MFQRIAKPFRISIHALLAESDVVDALKLAGPVLFLSTLSLRRATGPELGQLFGALISIHALLAESDPFFVYLQLNMNNFYPRSPCGERL